MDPDLRAAVVRRIVEQASTQHQVVTAGQLASAGLDRRTAESLSSDGWLNVIRPGAYLIGRSDPTGWQKAVAAALVAGPGAVLSHFTAARVHRLPHLVHRDSIELSVLHPRHPRLKGVDVHSVRRLDPADVESRSGVAVTGPSRTVCDLAGRLSGELLERVVDEGFVQRLWTPASISSALERSAFRPGVRAVQRILAARRDEEGADSALEQQAARILTRFRPFELQYQLALDGQICILDIAWPEWKVAVECDGYGPHGLSRRRFDRDRRKGNLLLSHGWAVVHFTSAMGAEQLLTDVGRLLPARVSGALSRRVS